MVFKKLMVSLKESNPELMGGSEIGDFWGYLFV